MCWTPSPKSPLTISRSKTRSSADWLIRQIGKGDRGPVDYVDSYLAKHPYQPSDWSQHELRCLAEILETAGCYDQLSLPSLAFVEYLVRRWQMILAAHSRNPLAPNYKASEYYSGNSRGRHGIAPMLSAHVACTMKDESEIDKQRNKARDVNGKDNRLARAMGNDDSSSRAVSLATPRCG